MEGCEACLIDASKVILFSAGQGCWGSVVSKLRHPIPFHSILGYYPSMAFSPDFYCSTISNLRLTELGKIKNNRERI